MKLLVSSGGYTLQAARRHGFTLIEVMVSVVILAVGMVLVIESLQGAFRAVEAARDTTRLSLLAQALLDETGTALQAGDQSAVRSRRGVFDSPWEIYGWERQISIVQPGQGLDSDQAGTLYRVDIALAREGNDVLQSLTSYIWQAPEEERDGE